MIFLVGGRGTGKTTTLMKISQLSQIPICVSDRRRADFIKKAARDQGITGMPDPVVASNIRAVRGTQKVPRFVVDDVETVLGMILGGRVPIASISSDYVGLSAHDISKMSLIQIIKTWWRYRKLRHLPLTSRTLLGGGWDD